MKILKIISIFLMLLFSLQCSDDEITNIEFTATDHPISMLSKEKVLSIVIIPNNEFYSFSDDHFILNCEGDGCNDYLVKNEEMNDLIYKLSDTNYFDWQFMTAVTPYPETDCNLLIYGKDSAENHLDYMCTIGRGEETYKIIMELSETFSGEAQLAFVELANHYKN